VTTCGRNYKVTRKLPRKYSGNYRGNGDENLKFTWLSDKADDYTARMGTKVTVTLREWGLK
jgi:hypothetical protein